MKKIMIILLALVMLLCAGCNEQTPVETQPTETQPVQTEPPTQPTETEPEPTETEPPEPQTAEAEIKADNAPAVLVTLNRDDQVELVADYDEQYYIVKAQELYGLVRKSLLRTEGQEAYQAWTGYSVGGVKVYDNLYLQGEAVGSLVLNETVEVVEDLGLCYLVRYQEQLRFLPAGSLSRAPIQYSGGGGNSGGADGGDIILQAPGVELLAAVAQEGEVTGKATVLADGTDVVLCFLNWGDKVQVVTEEGFAEPREGFVTVYVERMFAYVPENLIRQQGEAAYETWSGYANYNAAVYDNVYLVGEAVTKPGLNTAVQVIEDLGSCYLVKVGETTGFMAKELVSATQIPVSSGGDSGGDWTPPAM